MLVLYNESLNAHLTSLLLLNSADGFDCTLCPDWRTASVTPPGGLVPATVYGGATEELACACPPGYYSFTAPSQCSACADIEVPELIEEDKPTKDFQLAQNLSLGKIPDTPVLANSTHRTCPGGRRGAAPICPMQDYYVTTYRAVSVTVDGRSFWRLTAQNMDPEDDKDDSSNVAVYIHMALIRSLRLSRISCSVACCLPHSSC